MCEVSLGGRADLLQVRLQEVLRFVKKRSCKRQLTFETPSLQERLTFSEPFQKFGVASPFP